MRAKICPISGPGHLSKSERERRAREIVAESGADALEHFDKVVKQAQGVTFREQAKWRLDHIQRRKRKPIAGNIGTVEGLPRKMDQPRYRRSAVVRRQQ